MTNVLAINSSHRKNGCTKRALDIFLEGIGAAQVERIDLIDLEIAYCRGCMFCRQSQGNCIQKDDMEKLVNAYIPANIIVLGAPVYYNTVTSVLKTVIDRSIALHYSKKIKMQNPQTKKMVVLAPGAGQYNNQYRSFQDVLEFYVQDLNAEMVDFVRMPKLGLRLDADIEPYRKDILIAAKRSLR